MIEIDFIYLFLFFLIILQTIAGVGLLVIGTPLLLINNIDFINVLGILLPISITTSFLNLIIFKYIKKTNFKIDGQLNSSFFIVTIPFIFGGLYLVKNFNEFINFKYLVSFVIFLSVVITNQKKIFIDLNKKLKILFLSLMGLVHGISNSGGSLLSLFIAANYKKNQSRYNITYFYFYLAFIQFLMFVFIFDINLDIINFYFIFMILPIAVMIGNILSKYINDGYFRIIINFLSIISCIALISNI